VQSSAGGRKEGRRFVSRKSVFLFGFYMSGKGKEGAWMEVL
jgi:hypothetical protein